MRYYRFYINVEASLLSALLLNEDGTPHMETKKDIHRGRPCYCWMEAHPGRTGGIRISEGWRCPVMPTSKEYRPISLQEARVLDKATNYGSMDALFGLFFDEYEGELGKRGVDWQEIPHHTVVNQYWSHLSCGETYALQFDATDNRVISACGPLPYTEVTAANRDNWNFEHEPETAGWLDANRDQFKLDESPFAGDVK